MYHFLRVSMVENLMAWLEPCFRMVGVRPLYSPERPWKITQI